LPQIPLVEGPVGQRRANYRNGNHTKTVLADVGPGEVTVSRDRDAADRPPTSAAAVRRGRHGHLAVREGTEHLRDQAHLAEVFCADASRPTISIVTDMVIDGRTERRNGPSTRSTR
jgi:transposase-like protein